MIRAECYVYAPNYMTVNSVRAGLASLEKGLEKVIGGVLEAWFRQAPFYKYGHAYRRVWYLE